MAPGLGLIRNAIIDQHFAERDRIGRLLGAVAYNPRILGAGIDEDTAILVEDNRFAGWVWGPSMSLMPGRDPFKYRRGSNRHRVVSA